MFIYFRIIYIRPEHQTTGISMKSRLLSKLEGNLDFGMHYSEEVAFYGPANESKLETINIILPDFGMHVNVSSTPANFDNYLNLLMSTETKDNSAYVVYKITILLKD